MKYTQKPLNTITSIIKNHPKSTIVIAASLLCLSVLRKFHYKLVVHPGIMIKIQISEDGITMRTKWEIGIQAKEVFNVMMWR